MFELGNVVATPGALALLNKAGIEASSLIGRHVQGDWGDLDDEDKETNAAALMGGERLLSSYITSAGKVWIMTEWNRSVTTVLLPSEY